MIRRIAAIAAFASLPLLAACSSGHHHQAVAKPSPSAPATSAAVDAQASADCDKLANATLPLTAYDQMLIREANRITHGGNATRRQERQARRTIAAEVRRACPQFSYLTRLDTNP